MKTLNSEQLLDVLTYDSEYYKILTLEERCLVHKERARQEHKYPPKNFQDDRLQELLIKTYVGLEKKKWKRPKFIFYKDEIGNVTKIKV